jgi:hypothetical protein
MSMKRSMGGGLVVLAVLSLALAGGHRVARAEGKPDVKFAKRCLMINLNEGCVVFDVNRDGKLDIVAGTHWYAAPDFLPRPVRDIEEFSNEFYHNNGDHAYDVDGDGWVDIVSGSWASPDVFWFKNPGEAGLKRGLKWQKNLLKTTRGENEAYELRDFDGDDVPELFVSCWDKNAPQVLWKLTKDADGKPTIERKEIGPKGGHGYAFGDVNGDGREDILTEAGWYERPEGDIYAAAWKFHPETALHHPSCPFLVVDLNGDGRNDIIWGKAHDYGMYWWEQGQPKADGTTTWTEHLIDDSWSCVHTMVWIDIDGDGQKDLVTGKRVRGHGDGDPGAHDPECVFYYTWDKASGKFTRHPIGNFGEGMGTGMQIRVIDLNADGKLDVIVAGKTGVWMAINEGVK